MRSVVAALLVVALFAGCTQPDGASLADGVPTPTSTKAPTSATAAANATKSPLNATLTVDAVTGAAPFLVNFTLSSDDAAAANITWTLMVVQVQTITADNGTAMSNTTNATSPADPPEGANLTTVAQGTGLPAQANHTFLTAGQWTALLDVDLGKRSGSARAQVNVTAGNASAERVPLVLAVYTNTGLIGGPYALTNDPMMAHQCPGFNGGQDGYGCLFLPFPSVGAHDAMPAIVVTDAANFRLAFWDECHPTGHGIGFASGASGDPLEIPAGSGCGVVWSSNTGDWGEDRTFTLTVYDWLPEAEEEE